LPPGTGRNPDAPLLPPLDLTGAQAPTPQSGGRGGLNPQTGAAQSAPPPPVPIPSPRGAPASVPAAASAPIPPAPIPNSGAGAGRDKGPLSKLLGTL
jgi:hypothetical protein